MNVNVDLVVIIDVRVNVDYQIKPEKKPLLMLGKQYLRQRHHGNDHKQIEKKVTTLFNYLKLLNIW